MKRVNLLAVALVVAFSANTYAQEIETKVPYKIGGNVQKAFKESNKVAIGYFGVSQTTQSSASSTGGGGGAFAKMTVNFGGVDVSAYQAVVKEAYDVAVNKLKSLGYDVLTPEQLQATGQETYIPNSNPKTYRHSSNTVEAINIQPPVAQLEMDLTPLGYNPLMKKAKSINAHLLNFVFGATAVSFERGSRLAKKAKVAASPYLTFGGNFNSYPIGKGGSPAVISVGSKDGIEDIEGGEGLYETSKNHTPWLGSSKGKYVLDVDQQKYLAAIKAFLIQSVEKSIDRWHKELND